MAFGMAHSGLPSKDTVSSEIAVYSDVVDGDDTTMNFFELRTGYKRGTVIANFLNKRIVCT